MHFYELNVDGLVGLTHHYAGLSLGNLASMHNAQRVANPRAAALQGLSKMRFLHRLGLKQAFLPPHERPNLHLLAQLGFSGKPEKQLNEAYYHAPNLLSACYSASSMWAANAATVSSSQDCADQKVHFTAANLVSNLHRHQETAFNFKLLSFIFNNNSHFVHHTPLPSTLITSDEGAANHMRLCKTHAQSGINLFIYGREGLKKTIAKPAIFPARQTLEASMAIARQHQLLPKNTFYICQNAATIDAGVFHNDVIATANAQVLLIHELAWNNQAQILEKLNNESPFPLTIIVVSEDQVTLKEAIASYLFNSQIVSLDNNTMTLIAPIECHDSPTVQSFIEYIINLPTNPISTVHYLNLKQSMQNGGGPACLRLRIPLNTQELSAMHQQVLITESRLEELEGWVNTYYPDRLSYEELRDPALITLNHNALDELTQLLHLGSIYPFQQDSSCIGKL